MTGFNPRAREGRDGQLHSVLLASSGFNPRAREGRDASVQRGVYFLMMFQSTRP